MITNLIIASILLIGFIFILIIFASPNKEDLIKYITELEVPHQYKNAVAAMGYGLYCEDKFYWDVKELRKTPRKKLLILYRELKKVQK